MASILIAPVLTSCADGAALSCSGVKRAHLDWFVSEVRRLETLLDREASFRCSDYEGFAVATVEDVSASTLELVEFDGLLLAELRDCQLSPGHGVQVWVDVIAQDQVVLGLVSADYPIASCPS